MLAASRGLARPEAIGFGVYFDDPEQVPPAQLRSMAGMSVAPDAELGDELERFEIPAIRCAILTYTGQMCIRDRGTGFGICHFCGWTTSPRITATCGSSRT